jgi:Kef-type K+ transport system membrane component KefB
MAARSQGLAARESLALGVLMNTRGLTELVVLNVGRELGVLDARLFTLLVLMAVITTVATSPVLDLVKPDPWLGEGDVR